MPVGRGLGVDEPVERAKASSSPSAPSRVAGRRRSAPAGAMRSRTSPTLPATASRASRGAGTGRAVGCARSSSMARRESARSGIDGSRRSPTRPTPRARGEVSSRAAGSARSKRAAAASTSCAIGGGRDGVAQREHRPPVAVVRAEAPDPRAIDRAEIPEAAARRVEGVARGSGILARRSARPPPSPAFSRGAGPPGVPGLRRRRNSRVPGPAVTRSRAA